MLGRTYAGVLALVGFATVLARGLWHGASAESALGAAWLALCALAAAGFLVGYLAEHVLRLSVTSQLSAELAAQDARPSDAAGRPRRAAAENAPR
jgi:hypothetical protein